VLTAHCGRVRAAGAPASLARQLWIVGVGSRLCWAAAAGCLQCCDHAQLSHANTHRSLHSRFAPPPADLFGKAVGGDQLERLHLSKMRGIAQHVDVHQLCHIPVPVPRVLVLEGLPKGSRLLGDHISFLCCCLTRPHGPDQVPARPEKRGWSLRALSKRSGAPYKLEIAPTPYLSLILVLVAAAKAPLSPSSSATSRSIRRTLLTLPVAVGMRFRPAQGVGDSVLLIGVVA